MTKIHWRNVCEVAQRAHTEADAIQFWGISHIDTSGIARPIFNYRYEHTLATVKIARWLAALTGADTDITECSAWLHDCRKFLSRPQPNDTHAQDASAVVESILNESDFPNIKIPAVKHAIEHHVGFKLTTKLKPLETACLWDSDKLSKIGAAGLVHYISVAGISEKFMDTAKILEHGEQWLQRANIIADSMNTDIAKQEAQHRLKFVTNYYRQLAKEWADPMRATNIYT
jgi:uncharacterized protein